MSKVELNDPDVAHLKRVTKIHAPVDPFAALSVILGDKVVGEFTWDNASKDDTLTWQAFTGEKGSAEGTNNAVVNILACCVRHYRELHAAYVAAGESLGRLGDNDEILVGSTWVPVGHAATVEIRYDHTWTEDGLVAGKLPEEALRYNGCPRRRVVKQGEVE